MYKNRTVRALRDSEMHIEWEMNAQIKRSFPYTAKMQWQIYVPLSLKLYTIFEIAHDFLNNMHTNNCYFCTFTMNYVYYITCVSVKLNVCKLHCEASNK